MNLSSREFQLLAAVKQTKKKNPVFMFLIYIRDKLDLDKAASAVSVDVTGSNHSFVLLFQVVAEEEPVTLQRKYTRNFQVWH